MTKCSPISYPTSIRFIRKIKLSYSNKTSELFTCICYLSFTKIITQPAKSSLSHQGIIISIQLATNPRGMDPSPDNGGSSARREEKRRKQRESLQLASADPLECFSISPEPALRSVSQELADKGECLKGSEMFPHPQIKSYGSLIQSMRKSM